MSATYRRTDLHGKCGSCIHATPHPTHLGSAFCDVRLRGCQSLVARTLKACQRYEFDPSKLCKCGETKEPWYRYCPNCGERMDKEDVNCEPE